MPSVTLIDGKAEAKKLRAQIADNVTAFTEATGVTPGLAVILVGDDPASHIYVKGKQKAATKAGMNSFVHILPAETSQDDVIKLIGDLNQRADVHGILLQLPLPNHIDPNTAIDAILPEKDVDGLHPYNVGRMVLRQNTIIPCTPLGCLHLIKTVRPNLAGLKATVVGASSLVGRPMQQLLLQESCTVTQAHSKTVDLVDACRDADILVVATGRAGLISADHVKDGAIVIDVGISRIDDCRIVGDVDFQDVTSKRKCTITPVPGGVGPMTVAMLLKNTLKSAKSLHY